MRTDAMFDIFFEHVESLPKCTDTQEPALPRKRKVHSRYEVGEGEGYHSPTIKDHYRCYYFEALDLVIPSIQERFDQPGYVVYRNLEELLLKAANGRTIPVNWMMLQNISIRAICLHSCRFLLQTYKILTFVQKLTKVNQPSFSKYVG